MTKWHWLGILHATEAAEQQTPRPYKVHPVRTVCFNHRATSSVEEDAVGGGEGGTTIPGTLEWHSRIQWHRSSSTAAAPFNNPILHCVRPISGAVVLMLVKQKEDSVQQQPLLDIEKGITYCFGPSLPSQSVSLSLVPGHNGPTIKSVTTKVTTTVRPRNNHPEHSGGRRHRVRYRIANPRTRSIYFMMYDLQFLLRHKKILHSVCCPPAHSLLLLIH